MYKHYLLKRILLAICLFFSSQMLFSQDLLKGKDLSEIKVDQLSDADIIKLKGQLTSVGMSIDQAEQIALSKGMPSAEFNKLKQRLSSLDQQSPTTGSGKLNVKTNTPLAPGRTNNSPDTLDKEKYNDKRAKPLINPLIFGSELYTRTAPSFEPNSSIATPMNYVLGPNDEVQISVFGVQQYEGELKVSPEGYISIPNVGQVKIAGLTVEAATEKLKSVMGNGAYPYLKSGGSKLSLTLSKIRSIKVTVIGSSLPANYTVSSLATVFNVLYLAGGPSEFGSFREIELWRNNKLERKIDLYRLLLRGDQSDNVGLKDNDVILIPPYKTRVELQGQVKRPGIFEVLPGESFAKVLGFASGFTDTAYQAAVKVFQRSDKDRKIFDLASTAFDAYVPVSGDVFSITKTLDRFQNRVQIRGAVFRPDAYQLTPGLTVSQLIRKADGLKEDAFMDRAQIIRLEDNLTRSIVPFNIKGALAGSASDDIVLKREDEVLITSVLDLRDTFRVKIQGEVRMPGNYEYVNNLSVKDLILQAGGFTDAAFKNIEIARLIKRDSITLQDSRASQIINIQIAGDLGSPAANIPLQPFDVITIRKIAGYTIPESVTVSGMVQYPGPYAIGGRDERISSILKRAGGYTPDASPEGAYLKRYKTDIEQQKLFEEEAIIRKFQRSIKDTTTTISQEIAKDYDQIPLNLLAIMKAPGSIEDLIVHERDELVIPKFDGQVKVTGSVLLVTQVPFMESNNMKDYINEAGGFSGDAWRKKAYVVYANGKAAITAHFLFFKFYPKILPGSKIVVPAKPVRKGLNTGEMIGIGTAVASLASVIIAILKL